MEEIEWRDSWRVIVKSQCEVVSGLTPDTTCRERINPRPTVAWLALVRSFIAYLKL